MVFPSEYTLIKNVQCEKISLCKIIEKYRKISFNIYKCILVCSGFQNRSIIFFFFLHRIEMKKTKNNQLFL